MNQSDKLELGGSQYALQLAFLTMKERCKQLQVRLAKVEEENVCLKQQYETDDRQTVIARNTEEDNNNRVQNQQEKINELSRYKSELSHHIHMVTFENRQLWKRLTKLLQTSSSLNVQKIKVIGSSQDQVETGSLIRIPYSLRKIPEFHRDKIDSNSSSKDHDNSLEDVSLFQDKEYLEAMNAGRSMEIDLKNIGFTYPEDLMLSTDSLEQLKDHDVGLSQIERALLLQQYKLKNTLQSLKRLRKNQTCNNCTNSVEKMMCQAGTQSDSDNSTKENGATQTSLSTTSLTTTDQKTLEDENICPLCGIVYKKSISFDLFHEHVVNHFTKKISKDLE